MGRQQTGRLIFAAVPANTVDFEGLALRAESIRSGLNFDQLGDTRIADFPGTGTDVADQERHLVHFGRVMAGNESVDRFELVNEPVLEQKIERAIDRRRRGITVMLTQLVEQIVSLDRLTGGGDQFQHFTTQGRQTQATSLTDTSDSIDKAAWIIVMVMWVRFVQGSRTQKFI